MSTQANLPADAGQRSLSSDQQEMIGEPFQLLVDNVRDSSIVFLDPEGSVLTSAVRRIRALLIEDNPADVYLIREALKEELVQVELEVLDNGEAASALVDRFTNDSAQRPDVILLDLNLPRCDGKEVLQKLSQMPGRQRIPVVIITSSDSPQDREDCLSLGATCYFRKPSELGEFMEIASVIKSLLRPA